MYSGYKVNLDEINSLLSDEEYELYNLGEKVTSQNKRIVQSKLELFLLNDGSVDASSIQENWFPNIDVDVFLSHSHADEGRVIMLAGLLSKYFNLSSFIDSCVWGYSNNLLREIDNTYCRPVGSKYYSYEDRNYSTSHVHMMLSTALMMMIDNAECLMFIDTPNSMNVSDIIETTASPWIYSEIAMSRCIWKDKELHNRRQSVIMEKSMERLFSSIDMRYKLNTLHLKNLTVNNIVDWYKQYDSARNATRDYVDPLDVLYNVLPLITVNKVKRG
jgi:hypothetical protein